MLSIKDTDCNDKSEGGEGMVEITSGYGIRAIETESETIERIEGESFAFLLISDASQNCEEDKYLMISGVDEADPARKYDFFLSTDSASLPHKQSRDFESLFANHL